jgi:hypothetical protein
MPPDPNDTPTFEPEERIGEGARGDHAPAPGVGIIEKEEEPAPEASVLLQVASGFVFSLFVVLIGLMAVAVIRQVPLGQAIPAGGAKFVIGIGLVLLALLIAATRVRNKAANNLLVGAILGVAAIGLAVVAMKGLISGILAGK